MSRIFYFLFVAGVLTNFFNPTNPYFIYLDRYTSFFEIFMWLVVAIIMFTFKHAVSSKVNIETVKRLNKNPLSIAVRYLDYLFVTFVGVVIQDYSLFAVLLVSVILMIALRNEILTADTTLPQK